MNKFHTFAVLAYKESPHLQACIDSLKQQTIPSEIILCTSTPSAFLEQVAQRNDLRLFVNHDRKGIADDWNFALAQAATPLVTLAHQDDLYFPDYSKQVLQYAQQHKDALIIFSNYDEIVTDGEKTYIRKKSLNFFIKNILLKFSFQGKDHISKNKERLLIFGNPIGCPTVTFQKDNLGGFGFDANFTINMDWKAWHDISQKTGSFVWMKRTLVSHRIYSESETSRGLAENRRQKEDLKFFKLIWPAPFALLLSKIYSLSYKNNN